VPRVLVPHERDGGTSWDLNHDCAHCVPGGFTGLWLAQRPLQRRVTPDKFMHNVRQCKGDDGCSG